MPSETPPARPRRGLPFALKLLVSAAIVALLVRKVAWRELAGMARHADPGYIALSVLAGIALNAISAWKWRLLLASRGDEVPFVRLLNLYFVGNFVNNFFPSTLGGDVVRSWEVGKETADMPGALASVFVERFTGMTALMAIALLSFLANLSFFGDRRFALALGAGLAAYLAVTVAVLVPAPLAFAKRRLGAGPFGRALGKIVRVQEAVHLYARSPRALAGAMALSFLFHAAAMVNVWLSSLAFGVALPARTLVVIVPVIMFISALPVTVGGLGLFEWAYFFSFGASGAGGSPGMLVGLLMRAKSLAFSLYGGILYAAKGLGKGAARDG